MAKKSATKKTDVKEPVAAIVENGENCVTTNKLVIEKTEDLYDGEYKLMSENILLKKKKFSDLSFSELTSLTILVDKVQSYYDNMAHANKDIDENRGEYELAVKKLIAYRALNKGLIEIVENSISGYEF